MKTSVDARRKVVGDGQKTRITLVASRSALSVQLVFRENKAGIIGLRAVSKKQRVGGLFSFQ